VSILSEILAAIGSFAILTISTLGYFGIFLLMALESMIVPIPEELVLPLAGFIVAQGKFNLILVIMFSTLGSLTGSLLSYYVGERWGIKVVQSYGKYFLVDADDLKKSQRWFSKRGELVLFISRLVPVARHVISLAAGIGKMNIKKFLLYTFLGAILWNSFLVYLGYVLGEHWNEVSRYTDVLSIGIVVLLVVGGIYFIYHHIVKKKKNEVKK
jgi:membrane protein DedA with SNARE-associated domain